MPHDKNGTELKAGDRVALTGVIKSIDSLQPTYCNITLRCDNGMEPNQDGPETDRPYVLALSARMVEKIEAAPKEAGLEKKGLADHSSRREEVKAS